MAAARHLFRASRRRFLRGMALSSLAIISGCADRAPRATTRKTALIGYLGSGDGPNAFFQAFQDGLRERGYAEGENLILEARWPDGQIERYPALARELVALQPDVLVATNTLPALALQGAAEAIPIVFVGVSDP